MATQSLRDTDLVEVIYNTTLAYSEETHGKDYQEKCKDAISKAIVQWTRDNLSIGGRKAESDRPLRGATARMGETPRPAADFLTQAEEEADRRACSPKRTR